MRRHDKLGIKIPYSDPEYVRQPDIHTPVPSEDKAKLYEAWKQQGNGDEPPYFAFCAGYEKGEAHGHTLGFNKGAKQAINGLIGVADRGDRARELASGNQLAKPKNNLEAITRDQLTAEICNILAQYAVMPVDARVAATIDALNSLPGVEIKT